MSVIVHEPIVLAPQIIPTETILDTLPFALCLIDPYDIIRQTYGQAELFFGMSNALLTGKSIQGVWFSGEKLLSLIAEARRQGGVFNAYDMHGRTRGGSRVADVSISPLNGYPDWLIVTLDERSATRSLAERTVKHNAARSMTALSMTLAHEIKNPLSGIRGAAQLLEQNVMADDRSLTSLICREADRIVALINRMEVFSDERPLAREVLNIHYVLDHVKKIAENGFARHMKIIENYDPSLPSVWGNRDALIQVFLNLVKNSAEAAAETGGQITLTTAYCREMKLTVSDKTQEVRYHIPVVVSVSDNGATGIAEELIPNLFDPFVTTKSSGCGLGLPVVAKIIRSHDGVIEFSSQPGKTVFRVMLPLVMMDNTSYGVSRDNKTKAMLS